MSELIIAAQLFTLRDLLKDKTKSEIYDVLKKVKDIGYNAVQISGIGEVTPKVAKYYTEITNELELDVCATHFALEYMEENTEWIIELHKMWKCQYVGIGIMPENLRNPEGLSEFAKRCNQLGEKLKNEGIQLIYHNHKFEFEKYGGKAWLQHLLELFNPDYVQLEIDVYWVQAGGGNPVSWIEKVEGNMGVMHFKDMRIVKDEQQFAEIGQGNLEWDTIIRAAIKAKVKYGAVEQDRFTNDPIESLKVSYNYLLTQL